MRWFDRHFTFAWDRFTALQCVFTCCCVIAIPFGRPEWARDLGFLELIQMGIIVAGGIQAGLAGLDMSQSPVWRRFWNWSIWCWVLVLGRTVNWGRAFFDPSCPRIWFRLVCVVLVAGATVHFFAGGVYKTALHLVARAPWPFWIILIGVAAYVVVDAAEHSRYGLVLARTMRDIVEECLEMPVFAALFLMARTIMGWTKTASAMAVATV